MRYEKVGKVKLEKINAKVLDVPTFIHYGPVLIKPSSKSDGKTERTEHL